MEKYCKTIQNKLMMVSSEAGQWAKKENRIRLGREMRDEV